MKNASIKKQAKSDIFKELYIIINFYIRKGANPAALKKYYKNRHRFDDILDDIRHNGVNLIEDEEEYKNVVRDTLNNILDDFIAKDKDYNKKQQTKMKHIKEFKLNESNDSIITSRIKPFVDFLDNLPDETKVSAGDIVGYLYGWVDDNPEDEIETFD